jgi:hypothetical protein
MSLANFQRNAKNINEYYMKYDNNVEVRKFSEFPPVEKSARNSSFYESFRKFSGKWWRMMNATWSYIQQSWMVLHFQPAK